MVMADNAVADIRAVMHAAASAELAEAFPDVDPGGEPLDGRVLVQLRLARKKTKGGIFIPEDTRDYDKAETQIGKVRALGHTAFRDKHTGKPWPIEAPKVGDYVRVPRFGGDRWDVRGPDGEPVLFVTFSDHQVSMKITGDPLAIRAVVG